jgi:hypothetical protein
MMMEAARTERNPNKIKVGTDRSNTSRTANPNGSRKTDHGGESWGRCATNEERCEGLEMGEYFLGDRRSAL